MKVLERIKIFSRKKNLTLGLIICLVICILSVFSARNLITYKNGWSKNNRGEVVYYIDHKLVKGWLTDEDSGKKYYFDDQGCMIKGLATIDGDTYYFGDDGAMVIGEKKIDGVVYNFGKDGKMVLKEGESSVEIKTDESGNTTIEVKKADGSVEKKTINMNSLTNSSSSDTSTDKSEQPTTPAEPEQPNHTHNWVAITKTVHHDEEGHYEEYQVLVKEACTEEKPIYETLERAICNICGEDITDFTEDEVTVHDKNHMLNGENAGYHSEWKQVQTGTETIEHPAEYEMKTRWIVDKAAYDETVVIGYKCSSCDKTKQI